MTDRTTAALSLDLDNLWSYMRIHGEDGWDRFPSYFDVVVPRILELANDLDVSMTVFIVGKDADLPENEPWLRAIADAGHEVGNHSYRHEPWLHRYEPAALAEELMSAHDAIARATGVAPRGFRGPGFSITDEALSVLASSGYDYDSSLFPTWIGPLARWYYFRGTELSEGETDERSALFGSFRDGLHPNRPFQWSKDGQTLAEFPVTTVPGLKTPFHFSYVLYASGFSERAASTYFRAGVRAAGRFGYGPTMLLHPLDFLDATDAPQLEFFPAMGTRSADKIRRLAEYVRIVERRFDVVPMAQHVAATTLGPSRPSLRV